MRISKDYTLLQASGLPENLQALSPKAARFCLTVERFLLHELWSECWDHAACHKKKRDGLKPLQGKHIIVALSGGADSTALFLAFFYLRERLSIQLSAVHVHHGLRNEADEEAKSVKNFCRSLGITCQVHVACVVEQAKIQKVGLEEAGRLARYAYFSSLVHDDARPHTWIALGHHADDLCEDVLMRLIRGAGWPALGGMVGLDAERKIMRPLLRMKRADIENFLKDVGVSWIDDASNASLDFRRNRIRHQVMPLLLAENPALHETMLSLWKLARIDTDFWHGRLQDTMESIASPHILERNVLRTLSQAERLRLYKMSLDTLGEGQASVTTLLALDNAWQKQRGALTFQFSGHKIASISRGCITFSRLHSSE